MRAETETTIAKGQGLCGHGSRIQQGYQLSATLRLLEENHELKPYTRYHIARPKTIFESRYPKAIIQGY